MQIPGCMLPNTWQTFTVPYIKQVEKKAVRKLTTNLTNWASSVTSKSNSLNNKYMTIRYKQDLCSIERMYPTSKQTNEQN